MLDRKKILGLELLAYGFIGAIIIQLFFMFYQDFYHSYSKEHILDIAKFLTPVDIENRKKIRVGNLKDGGYVMLEGDHFEKLYSYGINKDIGFETDFLSKWKIPAYLYDHTINTLPVQPSLQIVKWYKEGIAPFKSSQLGT